MLVQAVRPRNYTSAKCLSELNSSFKQSTGFERIEHGAASPLISAHEHQSVIQIQNKMIFIKVTMYSVEEQNLLLFFSSALTNVSGVFD